MSAGKKKNVHSCMTNGDIKWLTLADSLAIESTGFFVVVVVSMKIPYEQFAI
jgi:hypothetical protein